MSELVFPSWLIPALFLTLGFLGGLVTGAYIAAKHEETKKRYRMMSEAWLKKYGVTQPPHSLTRSTEQPYGTTYREGDRRGI